MQRLSQFEVILNVTLYDSTLSREFELGIAHSKYTFLLLILRLAHNAQSYALKRVCLVLQLAIDQAHQKNYDFTENF